MLKVGEENAFQAGLSKLNNLYRGLDNYKGLPSDYLEIVLRSIEQRQKIKHYTTDYTEQLLKQTSKLKADLLPTIKWKGLSYLFSSNGLFKVANVSRNKAVQSTAYHSAEEPMDINLIRSFQAFADQGDLKSMKKTMKRLKTNNFEEFMLERMEIFYTILKGDRNQTNLLCQKNFSKADWTFFNLICGKKVAIVGPAPSEADLSTEINTFDVVIRFNYKGKLPSNGFGNRIDISYYNNGTAGYLNSIDRHFLNDLKFSCFKSTPYPFQKEILSNQTGRAFYRIPQQFIFNGSPHALPNVLFDILHFNPAKIKVFNSNLYLTNTPHYKGYQSKETKKINFWYPFAVHDLITQFNLLRNLWKVKSFEADKTLESVLNLTPEKYMELMEEIYVYPSK